MEHDMDEHGMDAMDDFHEDDCSAKMGDFTMKKMGFDLESR